MLFNGQNIDPPNSLAAPHCLPCLQMGGESRECSNTLSSQPCESDSDWLMITQEVI